MPDIDRSSLAPEQPSLSEMTNKSIELLSQNKNGFFLMVEGSQVDWADHANDPNYAVTDFLAFDKAVKAAVDFAKKDGHTLVLAFPDHNTGGMDRQLREDYNFTTNVWSFDRVISFFANEKIREFPRINSLAMKFFQNFSRSGLPAYIYIKTEKPLVSRIEEILNQIA